MSWYALLARPTSLIDLYRVRGNADPTLVAVALNPSPSPRRRCWSRTGRSSPTTRGKDKAVEFGLRSASSAEFKKLIGAAATGNGSQ
jgi:hypothetical protein